MFLFIRSSCPERHKMKKSAMHFLQRSRSHFCLRVHRLAARTLHTDWGKQTSQPTSLFSPHAPTWWGWDETLTAGDMDASPFSVLTRPAPMFVFTSCLILTLHRVLCLSACFTVSSLACPFTWLSSILLPFCIFQHLWIAIVYPSSYSFLCSYGEI